VKARREAAGNLYIQSLWESDPGRHTYNRGRSAHSGTRLLLFPRELRGAAIFWGGSSLGHASLQAEAHDSCVPPM